MARWLMAMLAFSLTAAPLGGCDGSPAASASAEAEAGREDKPMTMNPDASDVVKRLPAPQQGLPDEPTDASAERTAVFAGGCFWCVEAVFEPLAGVRSVVSGYAGGSADTADYQLVARGRTNHAEAVRVVYDPSKITYAQLLRVFFATHDPTQVNRQGPDVGKQYRTAVFYNDEAQRQVAAAYIEQLERAEVFDRPVATQLEPLDGFYDAEAYHQDFVQRNPDHGYVRMWALPKLEKLRRQFGALIRTGDEASAQGSAGADGQSPNEPE